MQYYQITLISKNEKSIKDYITFLNKNIKFYNLTTKLFNKKKKIFFLTLLKSPHVNKKAQEQFGYNIFSKQILLFSSNNYQLLLFFKKIEQKLFADVIFKIKLQLNKKLPDSAHKKIFNPDNFKNDIFFNYLKLNADKKNQLIKNNLLFFKKTKKLLEIFDIYGEITKKNF